MDRRTGSLLQLGLLLVGAAVLGYLVWDVGPARLLEELRRFGWGTAVFLLPGPVVFLLETVAWWASFLPPPRRVGLGRLYLVYAAGESLNQLLPGAYLAGEPVKVLMLRRWRVRSTRSLASILVMRTAMTGAEAAFMLLGVVLGLALRGGAGAGLAWAVAAGALAVVAGALGAALGYQAQRRGLERVLTRALGWLPLARRWLERRRAALRRLDRSLERLYAQRPGRFWLAGALCFAGLSLEAMEVLIFFRLMGLDVPLVEAYALGALVDAIKNVSSFIPASLGVQEGGTLLLLTAFGFAPATALTFAVLRRARELGVAGLGLVPLACYRDRRGAAGA